MITVLHVMISLSLYAAVPSAGVSDLNLHKLNFRLAFTDNNVTSAIILSCDQHQRPGCEILCAMTRGCKSFFYNPQTGICQLHEVIFNRTSPGHYQKDVQYFYRYEAAMPLHGHSGRIILISTPARGSSPIQYHIYNKTVEIYPVVTISAVFGMAYSFRMKLILFSTHACTLAICKLDDRLCQHLYYTSGETHRSLALDETKHLVFMTCSRELRFVMVNLKTNKCTYTPKVLKVRALDITLNTKYNIIYAAHSSGIVIFSYSGNYLGMLNKGSQITCLTYDNEHRILYYAHGERLMKMSMKTNIIKTQAYLEFTPRHLLNHNAMVYVSGRNENKTFFIGIVDGIYLGFNLDTDYGTPFCLVD